VKRCTVAYALPQRQWLWELDAPDSATVGEVISRAREIAGALEIPWEGPVGIFGVLCERGFVPRDGDRIEIYRPLTADPKVSRRERAKAGRAARDRAGRPPSTGSRS
jgi:putative ubiquitin-RnfH superfamily antitoxin RatB of RatAB toxin-antitoxin module